MKICTISSPLNIPAVIWGKEHEDEAISCYANYLNNSHIDAKVQRSGLGLDEGYHFLGASVDAIVTCKCHGTFSA